jgi:hypothetical protein
MSLCVGKQNCIQNNQGVFASGTPMFRSRKGGADLLRQAAGHLDHTDVVRGIEVRSGQQGLCLLVGQVSALADDAQGGIGKHHGAYSNSAQPRGCDPGVHVMVSAGRTYSTRAYQVPPLLQLAYNKASHT